MNQALTSTQTFLIEGPKKVQGGPRVASHSHYHSRQKRSADSKLSFDLSTAVGTEILETMPQFADQTVLVYTNIEMLAHYDHVPMGYMNRTNWIPQAEPLIYLPREQWDEHQFMPAVEATGDWVDIVVNNIDDKGHPFHLVRTSQSQLSLALININNLARTRFLCPHSPRIPSPRRLPNLQPLRTTSSALLIFRASSIS
jgi:hypothetical protein